MKRTTIFILGGVAVAAAAITLAQPLTGVTAAAPKPATQIRDIVDENAPSAGQAAQTSTPLSALQTAIDRNAPWYAGAVVDADAGTMTVYVTGDVPKAVQELAAGPQGKHLRIVTNAAFGRARVAKASDALISSTEWSKRLGLTMTAVAVDGSGLKVFIAGDTPSDAVKAELERFLGLPGGVVFVPHSEPVQQQ